MVHETTSEDSWAFCRRVLPDVSRSFAIIIPMCPPPIDGALCVAYLLCRIADTVEDTADLPDDTRAHLYDTFLASLDTGRASEFLAGWPRIPQNEYAELIQGTAHVIDAFRSLPSELRPPIRRCVHDMVAGMRIVRTVEIHGGIQFICRDLPDLDQYCHYVAGTVGIMSTALFEAQLRPCGFKATELWREQGRRFGLGLQMTNILKDCRVDAERGVSYIPADYVDLSRHYTIRPEAMPVLMRHTAAHLDAGMSYILNVPPGEIGIRTFLLGSLLPAIATLEVVAPGTEYHPKIDRAKMTEIFELVSGSVADDRALHAWYDAHRGRVLQT